MTFAIRSRVPVNRVREFIRSSPKAMRGGRPWSALRAGMLLGGACVLLLSVQR